MCTQFLWGLMRCYQNSVPTLCLEPGATFSLWSNKTNADQSNKIEFALSKYGANHILSTQEESILELWKGQGQLY